MTTLCVVQARMGSTRLPGKVLADLAGRPLLAFMLERLRPIPAELVVATSGLARDDAVEAVALSVGVPVVRGPESDVLTRFILALDEHPADRVVRLTADCPLVDPPLVCQALALQRSTDADYVSNSVVRTFPDGLDVEVVRSEVLRLAAEEATTAYDREHVTSYIYGHPGRFSHVVLRNAEDLSRLRWTVDTADDLRFVQAAVEALGARTSFSWTDVLRVTGRGGA